MKTPDQIAEDIAGALDKYLGEDSNLTIVARRALQAEIEGGVAAAIRAERERADARVEAERKACAEIAYSHLTEGTAEAVRNAILARGKEPA